MRERILPILQRHSKQRESLIPILQEVQAELGYLPPEAITEIAQFLGISRSVIYGVASFYAQFRFKRQGEHVVQVCQGTACHVRGGKRIMDTVTHELGIAPGQTSADFKFTLERIACFGSCALAPVMVIDKHVHGRMTTSKAKNIINEASRGK